MNDRDQTKIDRETLTKPGCLAHLTKCFSSSKSKYSLSVFLTFSFSLPTFPGPPLHSLPLCLWVSAYVIVGFGLIPQSQANTPIIVTQSSLTVTLNVFLSSHLHLSQFYLLSTNWPLSVFHYFGPKFTLWTWHCCLVSLAVAFWDLVVDS